jgi:hypothetical protein
VWGFEPFGRANRVSSAYCEHNRIGVDMRAHTHSSVVAGLCVAGILAAAVLVSPPQVQPPPTVAHRVQLAAAPALGAIPLAFIRNQFQYCSLICPYAVQGAITVPIAAVQVPTTFLGSLASTGSPLRAIGAAAASVTGPANAAVTPLINNDVFLVVPKAFHALDVAVVEAINVGAAVLTPGQFLQVVQNARTNILGALNQPVGPPTTPTGATNILQVVAVETINVATAVAFQAGELLLAGVVQTVDAAAQELARSGDLAAALAAGAEQARRTLNEASDLVVTAVDTALTNIRTSLNDPFPSTAKTTVANIDDAAENGARATSRRTDDADGPSENRSAATDSDTDTNRTSVNDVDAKGDSAGAPDDAASADGRDAKGDRRDAKGDGKSGSDADRPDHSAAGSSTAAGRSAGCCSNDKATPSAKKNRMNSGPPR